MLAEQFVVMAWNCKSSITGNN